MESFETRKVGKHLFIFEKGKGKSSNEKVKGRTLIASCSAETDDKLPPEFVKYMRRLFDILDENRTGFVKLSDIEAFWGGKNGYSSSEANGVLKHLRTVAPANGLLSFERLCIGFSQAVHSTEEASIANGSTGAGNRYENGRTGKIGQNSDSMPSTESAFDRTPTRQLNPVTTVQHGKQGQSSNPFLAKSVTFDEFYKSNGIPSDTILRSRLLSHKHKPECVRPKSMGLPSDEIVGSTNFRFSAYSSYGSSETVLGIDSQSCETDTFSTAEPKKRTRPLSMGHFDQPQEIINIPFRGRNPFKSNRTEQNIELELSEASAFSPKQIEGRRRPKSVVPFSEQKNLVDLSVAKKKGGILEGIQKTDKKAVIDQLKQWRDEELKKSPSPDRKGAAKQLQRVSQGYQSDSEGSYYRQRRAVASRSCTGNETDFERHDRISTHSSSKSNERRAPRTTVQYQGQVKTKNDTGPKTTAEQRDQISAKEEECAGDVDILEDELRSLKDGLRIVDEVRGCLVKRIGDLQEQKLYEQLNKIHCKECSHDVKSKTSGRGNCSGKTGRSFEPLHIESLSSHFKSLKAILDQVKQTPNDH